MRADELTDGIFPLRPEAGREDRVGEAGPGDSPRTLLPWIPENSLNYKSILRAVNRRGR